MNEMIKYSGIVLLIIGAILLSIYVIQNMTSNALLVTGGLLVVGGTALYVVLTRIFE